MTEHDEQLLTNFFKPAREATMEDDTFCERVMQRLPQPQAAPSLNARLQTKALRLSRIWTGICIVIAAILFVVFQGWLLIKSGLLEFWSSLQTEAQPLSLILIPGLAGAWILYEVLRRERQIFYPS